MMFQLAVLIVSLGISQAIDENILDYYTNLIENNIKSSKLYKPPENAFEYKPEIHKVIDLEDYDFIVVGSGTAGSIVAARLSEVSHWKVLVLEAGDYGNDFTDIPGMNGYIAKTKYNWGYKTTQQSHACLALNGRCNVPRGKGIGGNTILYGCRYMRGNKRDFDYWKGNGDVDWSYDKVLPYFKKLEKSNVPDREAGFHGEHGTFNVEYSKPTHPFVSTIVNGWSELGYKKVDYNGNDQLGLSRPQLLSKNGVRQNTGKIFVESNLQTNLDVITQAYVSQIILGPNKLSTGVIFSKQNRLYRVNATKEVILSAGAIASPQLLMLSGIGPKKHLQDMEIDVKLNLPVGLNMKDHIAFPMFFNVDYLEPNKTVRELTKEYLNGSGQYALALGLEVMGFFQTKHDDNNIPDLLVGHTSPYTSVVKTKENTGFTEDLFKGFYGKMNQQKVMTFDVAKIHLNSVGSIQLKSKDPYEYPMINPNYFSHPDDMEGIVTGIEMVLKLLGTKSFQDIKATLGKIDPNVCNHHEHLSKEHWRCLIKYYSFDSAHHHATCKLGNKGVVDTDLKVHGVGNLRVVDASVIPYVSAYPAAVVMMLAEKISDVIKLQNGVNIDKLDQKYFTKELKESLMNLT